MEWWVWILVAIVILFVIKQLVLSGTQRIQASADVFATSNLAVAEAIYEGVQEDFAAGLLSSRELYGTRKTLDNIRNSIYFEARSRGAAQNPDVLAAQKKINQVFISEITRMMVERHDQEVAQGNEPWIRA